VLKTDEGVELRSVKNPDSSGSSGLVVLASGIVNTGESVELTSVKNPDSSGSSGVLTGVLIGVLYTGESVELTSEKNPDSSGSSYEVVLVSFPLSEVEYTAGVEVRLDKGPVYERDDKLELVRPIPASIVLVLASACEVDRLVL
jgi:hypothetical protein